MIARNGVLTIDKFFVTHLISRPRKRRKSISFLRVLIRYVVDCLHHFTLSVSHHRQEIVHTDCVCQPGVQNVICRGRSIGFLEGGSKVVRYTQCP